MGQYGREHGTTGPNPISENTQPVLAPRMRFLRSEPVTEPLPIADAPVSYTHLTLPTIYSV